MSLVSVTGHPLLTNKVVVLAPEKFSAQHDLAEALLGLDSSFVGRLTTEQLTRVQLAVVLQLNFQVEQGLDPYTIQSKSSTQQGESVTYRPDAVHPQAKAIIDGTVLTNDTGGDMVRRFRETSTVRSVRNDVRTDRLY